MIQPRATPWEQTRETALALKGRKRRARDERLFALSGLVSVAVVIPGVAQGALPWAALFRPVGPRQCAREVVGKDKDKSPL
jgi:hypothetical protein